MVVVMVDNRHQHKGVEITDPLLDQVHHHISGVVLVDLPLTPRNTMAV